MGEKERSPVWRVRSGKQFNRDVRQFMDSTTDDELLIKYDIESSLAHAEMLRKINLLTAREFNTIKKGLKKILADYQTGRFKLRPEYEDVHMNVEFELKRIIGNDAEKLHTARSRNDLIASDLRLYCCEHLLKIAGLLIKLQRALLNSANKHAQVIIPGYTHLQQAQPVLVSFYLSSYFFKFQRDLEQLFALRKWLNVSPLGSCAFAGTGIAIDRDMLARKLGFDKPCENALDGVSDRDFLCDFVYYLNRINLHLSHLAEDFVIFATREFNLISLDDSIATGSSIMPHKKNPDVCEVLRARSGTSISNLVAILTILKGSPSSYNRDLQELKSILFKQVNLTMNNIKIATLIVKNTRFQSPSPDWSHAPDWICINDLIDFLTAKGYRFRSLYNLMAESISKSSGDVNLLISLLAKRIHLPETSIGDKLTPVNSISNKVSSGSTGYFAVKKILNTAKRLIDDNEKRAKLNKTY